MKKSSFFCHKNFFFLCILFCTKLVNRGNCSKFNIGSLVKKIKIKIKCFALMILMHQIIFNISINRFRSPAFGQPLSVMVSCPAKSTRIMEEHCGTKNICPTCSTLSTLSFLLFHSHLFNCLPISILYITTRIELQNSLVL